MNVAQEWNPNNNNNNKQNESPIFPMPFGDLGKCCRPSVFINKPFDKNKLNLKWISTLDGNTNINIIKQEVAGIALLLSWNNRWLFNDDIFETQFWQCFKCTINKFEKGIFGQSCIGAIIAIYDEN